MLTGNTLPKPSASLCWDKRGGREHSHLNKTTKTLYSVCRRPCAGSRLASSAGGHRLPRRGAYPQWGFRRDQNAQVKVFYDRTGNTLTVWFGDPQDEYNAEETGDEVILMKDRDREPVRQKPGRGIRC
jgi:hypothetical protein